jgi:multidrug efflux system outer membrane protein
MYRFKFQTMLSNSNRLFYKSIPFSLIVAVMLGCSAGKNYKRPELNAPQHYSSATSSDSSIARQSWKEFFQDTTLLGLIDKSLAHNFDLQIAIKRLEASRAYARQARAAWLPALTAQASASTSNPSQNSLNGLSLENFLGSKHLEDYTLSGTVSWELDVWGKIRRGKQAALADYLQTYEATHAVQTSLVAEVANGYYNLLMIDAQLNIAKRNVFLSDSIVQMIRLQKTAGEVTELGVQQSVAQLQNAQLLVPQLEQATALQENALRLLIGDWPGAIVRSSELKDLLTTDSLSAGVPADLLRYRPDVRANEMALVAANARVGVAQANLYPSLTLTATGGLNAFKPENWFSVPASIFNTAAAGLTQPIFNRRVYKTQLQVARVERDQRAIEFRQAVMTAAHEVTNALVKLDKLKTQQQVADERAQTLDSAVRNAQLLFRSGMANYLEIITAQSRALQAELEKAAITRQQMSARVELYQTLGGGWQ